MAYTQPETGKQQIARMMLSIFYVFIPFFIYIILQHKTKLFRNKLKETACELI